MDLCAYIDSTCEHGTVHLVDSDDLSRGRVEYCYEGSWYSVCDSGWDEEEARVVCNTLGYDTGNVSYTYVKKTLIVQKHATTISEPLVSNFGRGTRPILPKAIECTVDDDTLSGCATTDLDISQCEHEAGVVCDGAYNIILSLSSIRCVNSGSLSHVAPCFIEGITSCTRCGDRIGCDVGPCNCYSNCYEFGDCCPDVSHVQDCISESCTHSLAFGMCVFPNSSRV